MAIITISREMGTGAYAIAKDVAKKLKYTLIDGQKISEMAGKYGLTPELLERVDEKPPVYITAEDRMLAAHLNSIELILIDYAKQGNVILYGRGAQDLLSGLKNVLRLRFTAPFEERVEKFAEREWIDPDLARELIRRSDHQRGGFIHFYFNRNWNDPLNYDIVYNSSRLSKNAIVDSIIAAVKEMGHKDNDEEDRQVLAEITLCKTIETEILKSNKIGNLQFKIYCDEDKVRLSGHVNSEEEKSEALKIACGIPGVKNVLDDLQVVSYTRRKE